MKTVARVLPGIIALFLLASGVVYMFNTDAVLSTNQLTPNNAFGYANIKANMGGPFLTFGIFAAIAAIQARKEALLPIGLFFSVAIIGRIFSLIVDGVKAASIRFLIIMIVFLIMTVFSYTTFQKHEGAVT